MKYKLVKAQKLRESYHSSRLSGSTASSDSSLSDESIDGTKRDTERERNKEAERNVHGVGNSREWKREKK